MRTNVSHPFVVTSFLQDCCKVFIPNTLLCKFSSNFIHRHRIPIVLEEDTDNCDYSKI